MPFKVAARTIFHLGSELISSDGIAFYELIKNSFDAQIGKKIKRVTINVVVRIPYEKYIEIIKEIQLEKSADLSDEELVDSILRVKKMAALTLNLEAPNAWLLKEQIEEVDSYEQLKRLLESSNYIEIIDKGEGMSQEDLNDIYLTIGTRSRFLEREAQKDKLNKLNDNDSSKLEPILGEKGVGRLSTMRLGNSLKVVTSESGEIRWNTLEIDWSRFSHDSDELIQTIDISPKYGKQKEDAQASGTKIFISSLTSEWTKQKLLDIAKDEFSKLIDPFVSQSRYRISIRYNDELLNVPKIDEIIFKYAHAIVEATFHIESKENGRAMPSLSGRVEYRNRNKIKTFLEDDPHQLLSFANVESIRPLVNLGPFKLKFYWFNRKLITRSQGIPDWQSIKKLIAKWAGGIMVYRDGFRVNPYGGIDDDWLDIDKYAFSSPGYKVNRQQIVGKLEISSYLNPNLVDQTNREGLKSSEEKDALINLLRHIILTEFKEFIQKADKEAKAREPILDFDELEDRVVSEEKQLNLSMKLLIQRYPQIKKETEILKTIDNTAETLQALIKQARSLAEEYEQGRSELLHLAGMGLMVEILGHELNRATAHVLNVLSENSNNTSPSNFDSVLHSLKTQLGTLQKRLRILDPLSTAGRQRKVKY